MMGKLSYNRWFWYDKYNSYAQIQKVLVVFFDDFQSPTTLYINDLAWKMAGEILFPYHYNVAEFKQFLPSQKDKIALCLEKIEADSLSLKKEKNICESN